MISVHYIPSLSIAKNIAFFKIPELGACETIVDGGWWSEDVIAVLSSSGKFILLPFKTMEIIEAENFKIPSIFIPSPIKSIFVLEQTGNSLTPDVLKSMQQLLSWSREEPCTASVNYKLYQLIQTSPSILFYQKIENKEYGEALLLANKFQLDKNEVYKTQWTLGNEHLSAVNDFLCKITDYQWVLDEIEKFVPNTGELSALLLDHGLNIIDDMKSQRDVTTMQQEGYVKEEGSDHSSDLNSDKELTDKELTDKETSLLNSKVVLTLYTEILGRDDLLEFDGELFKVLCTLSVVDIGILFAKRGTWTALDVLMTKSKTRPLVEPYWLVMLSFLPETLDPYSYSDILPEYVSQPALRYCVDTQENINTWYGCNRENKSQNHDTESRDQSSDPPGLLDTEVGYWDEEQLEGEDWDISTLPSMQKPQSLDLPPSLDHLLGPMTALSVYQWYTARVDQILSQSGLFDHAAALLDLALERLVPVNIYKSVLKLIEEAVTQLNFEGEGFDSILSVPFPLLLSTLLANCQLHDRVGHIVDVYLPFVQDLENVTSCTIDVRAFIRSYVVEISKESLLPALQVLQSLEFNSLILKEDGIEFASQCLRNCTTQKSWVSIAKEIIETLDSSDLRLMLEYGEYAVKMLDGMSPSKIFSSFVEESLCRQLMEPLLRTSFKHKDLSVVELVKQLVDNKIIVFDFCFQLVFEQCLETGDLEALQNISRYRLEYLPDIQWLELADKYCQLYLQAATTVDHPYIDLVRFLLGSGVSSPVLSSSRTKLEILADMKKMGVMLPPGKLDTETTQNLMWTCISNTPSNYLQENLLIGLSEKMNVSKSYTYSRIAEIAYQNSNLSYCQQICFKAIALDYVEIVPVCVRLLKNPGYSEEEESKRHLLNFSLKHVSADQVDGLLDVYHTLPVYLEDRKRKLQDRDTETCLKIQRIASHRDVLDMEDTISNTDSLEQLYHMLLGRSIIETSCHIDKNPTVNVIINNALKNPSHDIKMISNKISDILQGNMLKELHGNVHVPRFTYDKSYRREVVLNIAAQECPDLAVSLGTKYDMDLWEIHFKHFQWLLLNDKEIADTIKSVLYSKKAEFKELCIRDIYPQIGGTKYSTLASYYTIMEDQVNLAAVNKIRSALPALDYKDFLVAPSPAAQLNLLKPLLNDGNVHVIAKVSPTLHSNLTKSAVFSCYAHKFFFLGEGRSAKMSYAARWHKVRTLLHYLDDATKEDLLTDICLSENTGIQLELRLEISQSLPELNEFLKRFPGELFADYTDSYFLCYLKSYQSVEVFDVVVMAMWLDPLSCQDVGSLLKARVPALEPAELADKTIHFLLNRQNISDKLAPHQEIRHIETVDLGELFEDLIKNASALVPQQSVIDKLKVVCSATDLQPGVQESVIAALEKHLTTDNDTELLLFFKTKPLVDSHWRELDIQPSSVLSEEYFTALCQSVTDLGMCQVLFDIVQLWSEVEANSLWKTGLLRAIASLPEQVKISSACSISTLLVDIICLPSSPLSETDITSSSQLFSPPLSHIITIASPHQDLHLDIIPDITLPHLDNPTLVHLLVKKHLYLHLLNTDLYPVLARELTQEGRSLESVREAAGNMGHAGNLVEAASLIAQFTRSSYATLASYRGFSKR